jgi:hypothetical protein
MLVPGEGSKRKVSAMPLVNVLHEAGFSVRRATETPFNIILEARP